MAVVPNYEKLKRPAEGTNITIGAAGALKVPDDPLIPFIRGDGIGPDIWRASERVLGAAVEKAFGGKKKIVWFEIFAGDGANEVYGPGTWLPKDTLEAIKEHVVAIKGPLTTPIGGGHRSINVSLRQLLDLYACVRPVRWLKGVPSPVKHPEQLDVVIFRENTEDVYAGVEWQSGSEEAKKAIALIESLGKKVHPESGIGIKPISAHGTKRLVRRAIEFAFQQGRKKVTLVHKGNIMKFTEGAFRDWGYELAKEEFSGKVVAEHDGEAGKGQVTLNDRIADSIFQQVLLRPAEYSVLACPNLNGDYLSDACAAQVGGLGIAPGANIGDSAALFEATHGTAPKYAGQDKVNPSSVILSGVMMLDHLGWGKAARLVEKGIEKAISDKIVTYDFARQLEGAKKVKCSEFGEAIVDRM